LVAILICRSPGFHLQQMMVRLTVLTQKSYQTL